MSKSRVIISALVVALLVIVSFLTLINPTTSVVFKGNISLASTGEYSFANNNTTHTSEYVDILLTYSLPVHLDPNRLNFSLEKKNGTFIEPYQRSNVSLQYLNLTYYGWYPHILTVYYINNIKATSSEITGEIYNPGGVLVGDTFTHNYFDGNITSFNTVNGDSYVQSGAIVKLPLGNLPLSGLTLTLHYTGAAGTSSLTLG